MIVAFPVNYFPTNDLPDNYWQKYTAPVATGRRYRVYMKGPLRKVKRWR